MKRLATAIAAIGLIGTPAFAADMAVKAPPPAPAPIYNWTGWYVGGNIGFGWGDADTSYTPLPTAVGFGDLLPTTLGLHPDGVIGGIQAGYNWQINSWVLGIEADFQGSDMHDSVLGPIIQNNGILRPGSALTASEKTDWFGTLRGRVGFTVIDTLLVYGTGGLAYGSVNYAANSNFIPPGTQQYPVNFSQTKTGWTAGAGAEWAFTGNWTAKIEYLHYDLGDESTIANGVPGLPGGTCGGGPTAFCQVGDKWKTSADIVRVGLNYQFH